MIERVLGQRGASGAWRDSVRRVVIHVSDYLDFNGKPWPGGRQRHVLDVARVVRDDWKRDVLIVQKAKTAFERTCPDGFAVVGVQSDTTAKGDPAFGFRTRRLLRPTDGMVYAAGEDAWPFFVEGAKGIQHGIWWDGPFSAVKLRVQRQRVLDFTRAVRSLLCVDTNFINWLRGHGQEGLELCGKCQYVPNYADLDRLPVTEPDRGPHSPLRLLFARRYEIKRGYALLLDALEILKGTGFAFHTDLFTIGGRKELEAQLSKRGLTDHVTLGEETLEGILARYAEADVAIVPTLWSEGTSLSCVEAVCAGLPVVTTPVGGLANIIVPEFNGLIAAPVPEQVAAAIARFGDEHLWRTMRRNCLSMRPALSRDRWRRQVLAWLEA